MSRTRVYGILVILVALVGRPDSVVAQFDSGSDGTDGTFAPAGNITVDLALADTGPGTGHYDADLWAVVFNYVDINIPAGVSVTFNPHPSGAGVVWLASGDVTIAGAVSVAGAAGLIGNSGRSAAAPGPGGFPGGYAGTVPAGIFAGGGYGPGGATVDGDGVAGGSGGSYATLGVIGSSSTGIDQSTYGNQYILPLIGGSGGVGGWGRVSGDTGFYGGNGGAGGGAILIASSGSISLPSNALAITADGGAGGRYGSTNTCGGGGGSGGAIRLMADGAIQGDGHLTAGGGIYGDGYNTSLRGGSGGQGRIRLEADLVALSNPPSPSFTTAGEAGLVFPPANWPTLRATLVESQGVPADPDGSITSPDVVLSDVVNPVTVSIAATNIPLGTPVQVHIVPANGAAYFVYSSALDGTLESSTATAILDLPTGLSEMQLRANWSVGRGALEYGGPAGGSSETADMPRYRRIHRIVGIETGPSEGEITYVTGDGRRVTYPAKLIHGLESARRVKASDQTGR